MSQFAEAIVRQRMRTAAIAAGSVAAVLLVQDVIAVVSFLVVGYAQADSNGGTYLGYLWQSVAFGILIVFAFAVGVGVSLWRFTPITGELPPTTVVVRGLLAAAIGAALVFVMHLGFGLTEPLAGTGSLFGNSFPELAWGGIWQAAGMALQNGVVAFLQQGPVVVLVVLLVWIWLGRHPSGRTVSTDAADV